MSFCIYRLDPCTRTVEVLSDSTPKQWIAPINPLLTLKIHTREYAEHVRQAYGGMVTAWEEIYPHRLTPPSGI